MNTLLAILSTLIYFFVLLSAIGLGYSILNLYQDWRDEKRREGALHQRMCEREMRRKIGL
jgi:hypothetical protein